MSEGDCVWVPGQQSGYLMLASSVQEREVIDVIDVSHLTKCFVQSPSLAASGPGAQPEGPVGVAQ